jgi:xanthine/uracil/vitamin C permease (AzgA family)
MVGFMANLPFILVPNLGMAIFFVFGMMMIPNSRIAHDELDAESLGKESSLVPQMPSEPSAMDLESALACVLITGVVMILLTVTGLVDKGMRLVPSFLKIATIAGIGMIITFIGLESAGLIIRGQIADLLTLSVPNRLHSPQPAFALLCTPFVQPLPYQFRNLPLHRDPS